MEGIKGVISGYERYQGKPIEDLLYMYIILMHVFFNHDYLFFLLCCYLVLQMLFTDILLFCCYSLGAADSGLTYI